MSLAHDQPTRYGRNDSKRLQKTLCSPTMFGATGRPLMRDTRFSLRGSRGTDDTSRDSRGPSGLRATDSDVLRKRLQYAWDEIAHLSQALKEARSERSTQPAEQDTQSAAPSLDDGHGGPATEQTDGAVQDLQRQVAEMQQRIEALTSALATKEMERQQPQEQLSDPSAALAALAAEFAQEPPPQADESSPAAPDAAAAPGLNRGISSPTQDIGAAVSDEYLAAPDPQDSAPPSLPPTEIPTDEPVPIQPETTASTVAGEDTAEASAQRSMVVDTRLTPHPALQWPQLPSWRWPRDFSNWWPWSLVGLMVIVPALALVLWHSKPTGLRAERVAKVLPTPAGPAARLPVSAPSPSASVPETRQPTERPRPAHVRDRLRSGGFGPDLVVLGPGKFSMGASDMTPDRAEMPAHPVEVGRFLIAATEVTFEDYDRFARETGAALPDDFGWGRGQRPVVGVSWGDAVAYTRWLSSQTGHLYRLPSEAEWEYAARAGSETFYWWGNEKGANNAVCFDCGSSWDNHRTAPVGSLSSNPFGLYDTAGNVSEWVADCWFPDYTGAPGNASPRTAPACQSRVARGGAFNKPAASMHSSTRHPFDPVTRIDMLGFRVARDS
jgi:formylglycine-generating enzyme required for sulfatase activity